MIKKIFLFLIILSTWYTVAVFKAPVFADNLAKTFNLWDLNSIIRDIWITLFGISDTLPSPDKIVQEYNKALSWAIEAKNKAVDWVNTVKEWIDTVRTTMSWAVDSYNDIKWNIVEIKQGIDNTIETVNNTADMINNFSESINETLSWSNLNN